jgi:hypothetical protein
MKNIAQNFRSSVSFTRPVPSDLAEAEELLVRFARWDGMTKRGYPESIFGRLYSPKDDPEHVDYEPKAGEQQQVKPSAGGEADGEGDESGAALGAVLRPMTTEEALRVSRAWSALPKAPYDLVEVLREHYLKNPANIPAACRSMRIPAGEWCSLRDTALRMFKVNHRVLELALRKPAQALVGA